MKFLKIVSGMAMVAAMAACGSDSGTTTTPDAPPVAPDAKPGFPQPAGTVAVNFSVDDTANKAFAATQSDGASDLWWKGAIAYDPATRKVTYDSTAWSGTATANMWARLYDDGPWTTGGHEPMGAVAGDHKWGITVFATPPATAMQAYDYGLTDGSYEKSYGNGWMWPSGPNGTFTVHAGDTAAITAPGLTIPAFGTTDMQIVIDTT